MPNTAKAEEKGMTKIDIFSGFLGAGKTTLIKKLIKEVYSKEKVVLIENEFGEIGIDGGFMADAGIEVTEMNSGCICCSLVGDFGVALGKVLCEYSPDRIIIEPSGVGKLSDVIRAVEGVSKQNENAVLNAFTAVVDAKKCKMYMKNFGEFFNDQIEHAGCIVLSHVSGLSDEKIADCVARIREHNANATLVTTAWESLDGEQLLKAMERKDTLNDIIESLKKESEHDGEVCPECGEHHHHHHHHHDHDEHDHDHDHCCHHEHEHEHEHHDHDCCHHDHDHHHEHDHDHHDHDCCHHDHHHHHADEVFTSWGVETTRKFTAQDLKNILEALDSGEYGTVLRAKGIVACVDSGDKWIHFDYVPAEPDVRLGSPAVTGMLCVIGSKIDEKKLAELFGV